MRTNCPAPGRLRAWLDREDLSPTPVLGDTLAEHVEGCDRCQPAVETLRDDAGAIRSALAVLAGPPPSASETELALLRLRDRLATEAAAETAPDLSPLVTFPGRPPTTTERSALERDAPAGVRGASDAAPRSTAAPSRRNPMSIVWQRWRIALSGLAAALALTFVVATPEGQAAAAGFLSQFRSQRLAIVSFDPNQSRQTGLFRLEQFGTVQNKQPSRPAEVGTVQEAASKAGFPVLQPDPATLPAGAARAPKVRFSPGTETRLTFDRQKSRAYFDGINRKDLSLPDTLHNSTLVVALPPVVMLEYAAADSSRPALIIGEAREVQVTVEGAANLEEVRTFLLGLPDMPADLVRQLRSIQDWTSTLPIPVPIDKVSWQETTIGGAPAFILNDNTGLGSGVIWQRDGRILGVAGPMKATEIRRVAESLR